MTNNKIRPIACMLYFDDVCIHSEVVFIDTSDCHINLLDFIKCELTDFFDSNYGLRYGYEYNLLTTQSIDTNLIVNYRFNKRG